MPVFAERISLDAIVFRTVVLSSEMAMGLLETRLLTTCVAVELPTSKIPVPEFPTQRLFTTVLRETSVNKSPSLLVELVFSMHTA